MLAPSQKKQGAQHSLWALLTEATTYCYHRTFQHDQMDVMHTISREPVKIPSQKEASEGCIVLIEKEQRNKPFLKSHLLILNPINSVTRFNSHVTIHILKPIGLPWWLSGKESPCQHRRHGFDS